MSGGVGATITSVSANTNATNANGSGTSGPGFGTGGLSIGTALDLGNSLVTGQASTTGSGTNAGVNNSTGVTPNGPVATLISSSGTSATANVCQYTWLGDDCNHQRDRNLQRYKHREFGRFRSFGSGPQRFVPGARRKLEHRREQD